jgi:methylenetetrahydrofolate reductase (NADPH)
MESQQKYKPVYSVEFFPPKTAAGADKLKATRAQLAETMQPAYYSVTYGAGGSTQQGTFDTVADIKAAGFDAAPHLSCIGSTRDNIREILQGFIDDGINRVVALRGDLPSGMGASGELHYANELVEFIRKETGDHFEIEVAAYPEFHPQAKSVEDDLNNFKRKIDAGADSAITQYFFNPDAYFRFIDDCEELGIEVPIIPGIMPITNYKQLARFSDMCGAEIPRWIAKRLQGYGDDIDAIKAFGEDVISEMCNQLLEAGAPGLHFYTMNQAAPTLAIWNNLGIQT